MSQAQDRHISLRDLPRVGMLAIITNAEDLARLSPRIQNEVRASQIKDLEKNERPLDQIEFGDGHPFGRTQYEKLAKLREEQRKATSQQAPKAA